MIENVMTHKEHLTFKNGRIKGNKKMFWREYIRQLLKMKNKYNIGQIALMKYILKLPSKYQYMVDVASHLNIPANTLWNMFIIGYIPNNNTRVQIKNVTKISESCWPKRHHEQYYGKRNKLQQSIMYNFVGTTLGKMFIRSEIINENRSEPRFKYECVCECGNIEIRTRQCLRAMRKFQRGMCFECHKKSNGRIHALITGSKNKRNLQCAAQ